MKQKHFMTYGLDTLFVIALSAAFCLLQGFAGTLIGMLISAVLAVIFYHEHYSFGAFNTAIFLAILCLFYSPLQVLYAGVPIVLLATSLLFGSRLKMSLYHLLLICIALFLAEFLVAMGLLGAMTGETVTLSSMMLEAGREMQATLLSQTQDAALQSQIETVVQSSVDMFIMLAPSIFVIFSAVQAYILIVIYKALQKKRKTDVSHFVNFDKLQAEKSIAIIFIILVVLLGALPQGMFYAATVNVFVILCFVFLALGLSVLDAKLNEKGMKKVSRRLLLVALGFGSAMLFMAPTLILIGYGLLDSFIDLRHLRKENSTQA